MCICYGCMGKSRSAGYHPLHWKGTVRVRTASGNMNRKKCFAVIIFFETRMLLRLQCVRSYLYQPRNVIWGLYLEKVYAS